MYETTDDAVMVAEQPLTEMRKRLEPLYRGISSVIQRLKDRKHAVPKELINLQSECSTLDRKIETLAQDEVDPTIDIASIDQEVGDLQVRVTTAIAPFEK